MPDPFSNPETWEKYLAGELFECFDLRDEVEMDEGALGVWGCGYRHVHVGILRQFVQRKWIERRARRAALTRHGLRALEPLRSA